MKSFARLAAALGLAAMFATTAVFAQAPTMGKKGAVKAHSYVTKKGTVVHVKAHTRMMAAKKSTAVKGYTRTMKSGKKVVVKGYARKAPMKSMKPGMMKPGMKKTM